MTRLADPASSPAGTAATRGVRKRACSADVSRLAVTLLVSLSAGACSSKLPELRMETFEAEPNCLDDCQNEPDRTEPEPSGCGAEDVDASADPRCLDECPGDSQKVTEGVCGCGIPETLDVAERHECLNLRDALKFRYGFEGNGVAAVDSVGQADGSVVNALLSGKGTVELQGVTSEQYVDLPNTLFSGLQDVTLEFWVTWRGGGAWQRVFDFGESSAGEGLQDQGLSYLMFTPRNGEGLAEVAFLRPGLPETALHSGPVFEEMLTHVGVVFQGGAALSLVKNGVLVSTQEMVGSLTDITFINNWLGRSQFAVDDEFNGILHEFRIYGSALTEAQLQVSYVAGPDAAFPAP